MTLIATAPLILALALAIDRLVGDPAWLWSRLPHPVVLVGRTIDWLDQRLNDPGFDFGARRRRGSLALALLIAGVGAIGWALDLALQSFALGWAVEAIVVAVFLAQKNLLDHVAAVELGCRSAAFPPVARQSQKLSAAMFRSSTRRGCPAPRSNRPPRIFRTESSRRRSGICSSAFPGLLIYKAVNTADSMIGNRSPRHAAFGWAAARLDDLLNFIPARLSALLIVATAALAGCDARAASVVARRDAPKHKSPNAGWPEAALAGALGLALGGPRRYGSEEVDGAWLNPSGRADAAPDDIRAAISLIDAAWALLLVLTALAAAILLSLGR